MKTNYGLCDLIEMSENETYKQIMRALGGANEGLVKELVCNAFLREAYESEVLNHRGLDYDKIKQYHDICRSFCG